MERAEAEEKVCSVLATIMNLSRDSLGPNTSRDNLEAWDSLKHMYLMLALEDELHVEFSDAEISGLGSVASLADALVAKTKGLGT
jgi:acyl carrier protein